MEIRSKSFVSARRVAEKPGVSRSAVSRTFTDGASVSEETRRKVLQAAEELGYHVNHLARGLINDRSNIICVIVADIPTPFQSRMLDVVTRRLQKADRVAMVINTTGDTESVSKAVRQTLNYRADATVVLSGTPSVSLIETCVANGQRVILINRDDHLAGTENIVVDNGVAAREALQHLRRAGCRRLAVVSSTANTHSLLAREAHFVAAARDEGLPAEVVRAGPTSYGSGAEAARQTFGRSDRPDGVFCVTDLLALGFMDALRHEFALRIPADVCVVGFDDIEPAAWESYNLTTFRQPMEQVADRIEELLNKRAPDVGERFVIQPFPVWRKSVRPAPSPVSS
jgi:DNA-binding LacI/PurR family transcriptional regulator